MNVIPHESWSKQLDALDKATEHVGTGVPDVGEFDVLRLLIMEARQAYEFGVSYRDFRVGAAALYTSCNFNPEDNTHGIVHGANFKPTAELGISIHGEQETIDRMNMLGAQACRAIAVVGDIQADQRSGLTTHTLHPCGLCRDRLTASELFAPSTAIITARPDLVNIEFGTAADYLYLHTSGAYRLQRLSPVAFPGLAAIPHGGRCNVQP